MTNASEPAASPFAIFGVLAPIFDEGRYLTFLNLSHQPEDDVAVLKTIVQAAAPSLEADIMTMLAPTEGWRPQVVGASAAIALGSVSAPVIEALWAALDQPSWAAPQLVAAAFLLDPDFDARARSRIEGLCFTDPIDQRREYPDSPVRSGPNSKQLAAMIALARRREDSAWLDAFVARPGTQAVLANDRGEGGRIADAWLNRAKRLLSPSA